MAQIIARRGLAAFALTVVFVAIVLYGSVSFGYAPTEETYKIVINVSDATYALVDGNSITFSGRPGRSLSVIVPIRNVAPYKSRISLRLEVDQSAIEWIRLIPENALLVDQGGSYGVNVTVDIPESAEGAYSGRLTATREKA